MSFDSEQLEIMVQFIYARDKYASGFSGDSGSFGETYQVDAHGLQRYTLFNTRDNACALVRCWHTGFERNCM